MKIVVRSGSATQAAASWTQVLQDEVLGALIGQRLALHSPVVQWVDGQEGARGQSGKSATEGESSEQIKQ